MKHVILENGLQIVTVPIVADTTTIQIFVTVGSDSENRSNTGIMHYLEHLCFRRGTKTLSSKKMKRELNKRVSEFDADIAHDYTKFSISGQAKFFKRNLALLADIYLNPALPKKESEIEKKVIIQEMIGEVNSPSDHYMIDLFFETVFGDQPAGWSIFGNERILKKINLEELLECKNKYYVAKNTIVFIAGKIDEKKAIDEAVKKFSDMPSGLKYRSRHFVTVQKKPRIKVKYKNFRQTNLRICFRICGASHDDSVSLEILSALLGEAEGSRIEERLRDDEGIAYENGCLIYQYSNRGTLSVFSNADSRRVFSTDKKLGAIDIILHELSRLREKLVPKNELERIKSHLINQLKDKSSTVDDMVEFYAEQLIKTGTMMTIQEKIRKIRKITPRKIRVVARRYFRNNRLSLTLMGPFKDKKQFQRILKLKKLSKDQSL